MHELHAQRRAGGTADVLGLASFGLLRAGLGLGGFGFRSLGGIRVVLGPPGSRDESQGENGGTGDR